VPIDLTGRPKPSTDTDEPKKPRAPSASGGPARPGATPAKPREKAEDKLDARLEDTLGRVAEWLEDRGETELSAALREDAHKMAKATVRIGERFTPLVKALVFLLGVVEPALAFGRVVRILFGKLRDWRRTDDDEIIDGTETVNNGNGYPG
jgi:hypothetical protein